jgi:hypothetical protein
MLKARLFKYYYLKRKGLGEQERALEREREKEPWRERICPVQLESVFLC